VVEELELDVLAFQDHPYQPGFLDTWTLLSFLAAIAAMGGPRRTAAENVDALEEAITIIRRLWTPGPPVHFSGRWYRLEGPGRARGPRPHDPHPGQHGRAGRPRPGRDPPRLQPLRPVREER
jgi:alkanesulfonate monooxygenase SsuD/methylene tetrahydromethanopterin reductase-like flavin-dependent oxidoreductase (luciferase family)